MGLNARQQQFYTRRLIDALNTITSRMTEYATGINGDISGVSGMLSKSDMTAEEKTLMAQIGQAVTASVDAVTRLRVLVDAADVPGDLGTAKADFDSVLSG